MTDINIPWCSECEGDLVVGFKSRSRKVLLFYCPNCNVSNEFKLEKSMKYPEGLSNDKQDIRRHLRVA
jgi:hypothetical protein